MTELGDLLKQAQRNVDRLSGKKWPTLSHCEECGQVAQSKQCRVCLFYYCERCQFGRDHVDTHIKAIRHEERA